MRLPNARRPEAEHGQSTVELALALPVVVMCIAMMVQVAGLVAARTTLADSAWVVARRLAVGDAAPDLPEGVVADVTNGDGMVRVRLTRELEISLPGIGTVGTVVVAGDAAAPLESEM